MEAFSPRFGFVLGRQPRYEAARHPQGKIIPSQPILKPSSLSDKQGDISFELYSASPQYRKAVQKSGVFFLATRHLVCTAVVAPLVHKSTLLVHPAYALFML